MVTNFTSSFGIKYCSTVVSSKNLDANKCNQGCVFLGESKNGFVISNHSDHGASKEPTNPCPEWIRQFL